MTWKSVALGIMGVVSLVMAWRSTGWECVFFSYVAFDAFTDVLRMTDAKR